MSVKENIEVARKWNFEVVSGKNVNALAEILHPQYQWRGGTDGPWSPSIIGIEGAKASFLMEPSNSRITIDDIFGDEDKVALRMTWWVGEKADYMGIAIYRFLDGKIIDDWFCGTEVK